MSETFDLLHSSTLTSAATELEIINIDQNYKDLVILVEANRETSGQSGLWARLNNDSSTSQITNVFETGGGSYTNSTLSSSLWYWSYQRFALFTDPKVLVTCNLYNYSATDKNTQAIVRVGQSNQDVSIGNFSYLNNAAITRFKISNSSGNFAIGTQMQIYGVLG